MHLHCSVRARAQRCDDLEAFVRASDVGRAARSTSATGANATSSRSHAALLLRLTGDDPAKVPIFRTDAHLKGNSLSPPTRFYCQAYAKFSLIDLAGSERGVDNDNTDKQIQMEGRRINQSLLALKEVLHVVDPD